MAGHREVNGAATVMRKDHEHKQSSET
jgi:hypothetical protein